MFGTGLESLGNDTGLELLGRVSGLERPGTVMGLVLCERGLESLGAVTGLEAFAEVSVNMGTGFSFFADLAGFRLTGAGLAF